MKIYSIVLSISYMLISMATSYAQVDYKHEVKIDIHNFNQVYSKQEIQDELARTQAYLDKCQIRLNIQSYYESTNPDFMEWETYWFNSDVITSFENILEKPEYKKNVNIIFLDSINWTIRGQGTWAIAYASYLAKDLPPTDVQYFKDHLQGSIVMGRYRARWTLAHELGHLLFGLRHIPDARNVMHTGTGFHSPEFDSEGLYITNRRVLFTQEQCDEGIINGEYLEELNY